MAHRSGASQGDQKRFTQTAKRVKNINVRPKVSRQAASVCKQYKPKKRGDLMALIKVKDVKEAIALMMSILEKLDEIYHALKDASKDKE